MDIGMLWFDNNPQLDLPSKITQAATYYQHKYGEAPNLYFVHPSMLVEPLVKAGAVELCSNITISPHHFWIGVQHKDRLTTPSKL